MEYLIDTSTLLESIETRTFDRFAEDERVSGIVVMPAVIEELERIAQEAGRRGRSARAAVTYVRQALKIGLEPTTQSHVDDALLHVAIEHGYGIITQDHELTVRAKEAGVKTLTLKRSGKIGD